MNREILMKELRKQELDDLRQRLQQIMCLFHELEVGDHFHDGFYARDASSAIEYMVFEKVSKSKAKVIEINPPNSKPRMLDSIHNFGAHNTVFKVAK